MGPGEFMRGLDALRWRLRSLDGTPSMGTLSSVRSGRKPGGRALTDVQQGTCSRRVGGHSSEEEQDEDRQVASADGGGSHCSRVDHGNTASALFPRQKCGSAMKAKTASQKNFVLQKVQPALLGLMDGAVSTLAPIFAVAGLTGKPENAFFVGLAASLGAGVSMGLAEALSDDGIVTGRGGPILRGSITGIATAIGGMLHTFPFLISNLSVALDIAYAVVVGELLAIAFIRYRFMSGNLWTTIGQVIVGGGIVFGIGIWLGRIGAS
jgi:hypothetical protein